MRFILAIVGILGGLLACQPPVARIEIQRVEVPVMVPCPPPPRVARPTLPIADLPPQAHSDVVVKAYVATVAILQGYAIELEALLDGYRKKP